SRLSWYTQLSAPSAGRAHMTPTTVASRATTRTPMTHKMRMPCRSDLLSGTISAFELPLFATQFFPDVLFQLGEVEVAPTDFDGPEVLRRRIVLLGEVAEVFHRALVRPRQALLVVRDAGRRPDQIALEAHVLAEIRRRRRRAGADIRLAVPLEDDIAGVLELGRLTREGPPLLLGVAEQLLVVLDVRLHFRQEVRLLLKRPVEHLVHQAAVLGLGGLVCGTPRLHFPVELPVSGVGIVEPVSLVRGENAEHQREH